MIAAARSLWYALTERPKLAYLRLAHGWKYEQWMPRDPLVSVYVPTHNRADLLIERCLKSILAQRYKNIEVIVVCDRCTDLTAFRLSWEFAAKNPRVKIFFNERPKQFPPTAENYWFAGRVDPANVGLEHCAGDWIATNDDDDIWTPDHVEVLLRHAISHDLEFVSGAYERERDGKREVVWDDGETPPAGGLNTWLYRSYLKSFRFNPDCWRKQWNKVCDTDLIDRFRKAGVRMGIIRKVVAYVLPRPGETTVGLAAYLRNQKETEEHFKCFQQT